MSRRVTFKLSGNEQKFCLNIANGLKIPLNKLAEDALLEACKGIYDRWKQEQEEKKMKQELDDKLQEERKKANENTKV